MYWALTEVTTAMHHCFTAVEIEKVDMHFGVDVLHFGCSGIVKKLLLGLD